MTRRERHLRIIEWHSERTRRWELEGLMVKLGLDALTDDAIEQYAARCVRSTRAHRKMNERNRAHSEASIA